MTREHSPSFVTFVASQLQIQHPLLGFLTLIYISLFPISTLLQSSKLGVNLSIPNAGTRGRQTLGLHTGWVQRVSAHKVSEITVTAVCRGLKATEGTHGQLNRLFE